MEFSDLGLSEPVAEALRRKGFTQPTPIQEQAIPPLLQGRDLMGRAETGSGKTLAFGIPLIERVESQRVSIQALVVCPTRELAQQVADDLSDVGREKGTKVALVVGGVHVRTQRMGIPGKQIVVGTPGRIIDLLEDRFLPVEWVEYFVLDEFDRLLDMGFLDDIRRIVKRLPKERQTALFSATVPPIILREAQKILNNPVQIQIGSSRKAVETIDQRAIRTKSARKLAILEKLLRYELDNDGTVIVFCNTKRAVRQVDRELWAKNFSVAALSGDHDQSVRFKVMERFRNQEIRVLVATDVAARGLDIDHIGHVINFDAPFETEDYVHRIGRTARAGRDGVVTTMVGDEDYQAFERIKQHLDQEITMISEAQCAESLRAKGPKLAKMADEMASEKERNSPKAAPEAKSAASSDFGSGLEEPERAAPPARSEEVADTEAEAPRRQSRRRSRNSRDDREEERAPRERDQNRAPRERNQDRGPMSRDEDRAPRGRGDSEGQRTARSRIPDQDPRESGPESPRGGEHNPRRPETRDDRPDAEGDRPRRNRRGRRGRGRGREDGDGPRDEQVRDSSNSNVEARNEDRPAPQRRDDRPARNERPREGASEARPSRENSNEGHRRPQTGDDKSNDGRRSNRRGRNRQSSEGRGPGNERSEGGDRGERGRQRENSGQNRPESSPRGPNRNEGRRSDQDSRPSGRNSSRDSRNDGRTGTGTGASKNDDRDARGRRRRSRHDYQRWEEEQLNQPIGLIEDSRHLVEERNDRSRGRGEDNDNAPAPFVSSDHGPAEANTDRRNEERNRRPRGGRSRNRDQRPESKGGQDNSGGNPRNGDSGKAPKRNDDIVW